MRTAGKVVLSFGIVCTMAYLIFWLLMVMLDRRDQGDEAREIDRLHEQLDRLSDETANLQCTQCEAELAECRQQLAATEADAGPVQAPQ